MSRRIPSIRNVEKVVPLRIKELTLTPEEIKVDELTYKVGIYREYPTGADIPAMHQCINEVGGELVDLDQYGFEDKAGRDIITPGDLVMKNTNFPNEEGEEEEEEEDEEEEERILERHLKIYEWLKAKKQGKNLLPILKEDDRDYYIIRSNQKSSLEDIQTSIDCNYYKFLPYSNRRNNLLPGYTSKIQLTICEGEKNIQIWRRTCDKTIHETRKQISSLLFGGRVKSIQVELCAFFRKGVLRLPENFKMRVRSLNCGFENLTTFFNTTQSIICPSSFPLKSLELLEVFGPLDHPMITSSEELIFKDFDYEFLRFLQLNNTRVVTDYNTFTAVDFTALIRNWITSRREYRD